MIEQQMPSYTVPLTVSLCSLLVICVLFCLKSYDFVTIHGITQQLSNPKFLSIGQIYGDNWVVIPGWCVHLTLALMVLSAILFLIKTVTERERGGPMLPLPVWLLIATTILIFSFSVDILKVFWLYVPAFFHGSQYLVLSASVILKGDKYKLKQVLNEDNFNYYLWVVLTGVAIYIGIPVLLYLNGINLIIAFNAVFFSVNLLHFLIDSVMWKKSWQGA